MSLFSGEPIRPTCAQIRALRKSCKMTQEKMAEAMHLEHSRTYQSWEIGEIQMKPHIWLLMQYVCNEIQVWDD